MRKAKPKKRIILPDPKYNDILVTKFVNNLMMGGKKTIAYKIFYEAIDVVADKGTLTCQVTHKQARPIVPKE